MVFNLSNNGGITRIIVSQSDKFYLSIEKNELPMAQLYRFLVLCLLTHWFFEELRIGHRARTVSTNSLKL